MECSPDEGVVQISLLKNVPELPVMNTHIVGKRGSSNSPVKSHGFIIKLLLKSKEWLLW